MSLRLVSINIERSKHLDRVARFLDENKPDVVCLQEVCERDIPFLMEKTRAQGVTYAPMTLHPDENAMTGPEMIGVALFFTHVQQAVRNMYYYAGSYEHAMNGGVREYSEDLALVVADVATTDGEAYRIATTHLTWTPDGRPTDAQHTHLAAMLERLDTLGDFSLVGDFNAPRGGEIFSKLAERYADGIPAHYTTSIDKDLHRAGDLQLMVDGLFTTSGYVVHDVRFHAGVSDHMAITATIEKI